MVITATDHVRINFFLVISPTVISPIIAFNHSWDPSYCGTRRTSSFLLLVDLAFSAACATSAKWRNDGLKCWGLGHMGGFNMF